LMSVILDLTEYSYSHHPPSNMDEPGMVADG
jgi:hypothetical protein